MSSTPKSFTTDAFLANDSLLMSEGLKIVGIHQVKTVCEIFIEIVDKDAEE